jgi:hypothetical protein
MLLNYNYLYFRNRLLLEQRAGAVYSSDESGFRSAGRRTENVDFEKWKQGRRVDTRHPLRRDVFPFKLWSRPPSHDRVPNSGDELIEASGMCRATRGGEGPEE